MPGFRDTLTIWRANLRVLLREWRTWILLLLLVGPVLAYIGFGTIWLYERGWIVAAVVGWIVAGGLFAVLAARWTTSARTVLPPLDWDEPRTFSPRDRQAWLIVEAEAHAAEELSAEALFDGDRYVAVGRRLMRKLAEHYHPESGDPLDHVPVVELLGALELAAEDLARMTRQIPGGDLITLSHGRRAMQMANYFNKANDLYALVSPFLNPLSGLTRIGTRELVVKPAWRNMQQNVLRWFFQAYVNRLGAHLVEMFSGRLAIGVDEYRRLTRRRPTAAATIDGGLDEPVTVAVVGARGSGKSRLVQAARDAFQGDAGPIRARLKGMGLDPALVDRLKRVEYVDVPGYTTHGSNGREARTDRRSREAAVATSVDADMLVLTIDATKGARPADVAFANAWDDYFVRHPDREAPPTLVVATGVDRAELGPSWRPPYDWTVGDGVREAAVRALFESLRASLPPTFTQFAAAGLDADAPFGVVEHVLPAFAAQLQRAERSALVRRLRETAGRSKVGRVMSQLGRQGKSVWSHLKNRRGTAGSS